MQDSNTAAVPGEGTAGLQPTPVLCQHQLLLQTGKHSWRGFKKGNIQLPGVCSTLGKPSALLQCSRKLEAIRAEQVTRGGSCEWSECCEAVPKLKILQCAG